MHEVMMSSLPATVFCIVTGLHADGFLPLEYIMMSCMRQRQSLVLFFYYCPDTFCVCNIVEREFDDLAAEYNIR